MLMKLTIRNFKRFDEAEIDLGKTVVLIGPNNSGKTTALQALALWHIGLHSWLAKRGGKASPQKRPGVTINRRDLISIPVPTADLLWHGLHVRNVQTIKVPADDGKSKKVTQTKNIRVDVVVEGVTADRPWGCGLEFDYSNEESFYCRPLRRSGFEDVQVSKAKFSEIPEEASRVTVAYLPPMSGLTDREFIKQPGEIGFLIGQGQTAEVLRNMCYRVFNQDEGLAWNDIVKHISALFGATLCDPQYIAERSEIIMAYDEDGTRLDLSSAGRGLQQTLLLLAHLYANPKTVLLIDEPDAHLEILRQRQTYQLLTEVAESQGSQIIAASHSEVVLSEAAGRGTVIAFVGKPHRLNDQSHQVMKALTDIGWDQYYQAETKGWLLCLEGSTDLAILRVFADKLGHRASENLERPFVHYVSTNLPQRARDLFHGLREAKHDLVGIAIFDHLDTVLHKGEDLVEMMWSKRELENYFCKEQVLLDFARDGNGDDLFSQAKSEKRERAMRESINEVTQLLEIDEKSPWSADVKATDEVLDRIFRQYFKKLKLPLSFRKSDYYQLAALVPAEEIDPEVGEKLNAIASVADRAAPRV